MLVVNHRHIQFADFGRSTMTTGSPLRKPVIVSPLRDFQEDRMDHEPEYRALLAIDIEHSGGRGNVALHTIRDVLFSALHESLTRATIDWHTCLRDDLGDGIRLTAPAGTPKTALLHPLVHELAVRLRAHNRQAGPPTTIRVRIALHAGDVFINGGIVTGHPLETLARMLDAPPAKTALANAPETVPAVAILSRHFYDETVRHGYPGIDPETFHKTTFTVKEHTADAWLHLPLSAIPPAPTPDPPTDRPATMVNNATGHGTIYATQNGTQHIKITRDR
jgi:hypothetical protein